LAECTGLISRSIKIEPVVRDPDTVWAKKCRPYGAGERELPSPMADAMGDECRLVRVFYPRAFLRRRIRVAM
jgi:hypothetical protein